MVMSCNIRTWRYLLKALIAEVKLETTHVGRAFYAFKVELLMFQWVQDLCCRSRLLDF